MNVNPAVVATGVVAVGTAESAKSSTIDVAADNTADDDEPIPLVAVTDTLMN